MDRTWTVERSQSLVRDRWIDLRADDCRTPSGQVIAPYYVLTYPDWVNILAVTPDRQVVFVRQYRHAVGAWVTELPGGVADSEDASLALAAGRELLEETGYRARGKVESVCSLYANPASHTNLIHTFLCRDAVLEQDAAREAGEEGMQVVLVPIDEVVSRLRAGDFRSSMHAAALSLGLMAAGCFPR